MNPLDRTMLVTAPQFEQLRIDALTDMNFFRSNLEFGETPKFASLVRYNSTMLQEFVDVMSKGITIVVVVTLLPSL